MGAFGIFAIVLTGIYIVYYAVIIIFDLYGKKAKAASGAVDIPVDDILDDDEQEEYARVIEHEDGTFDVVHDAGNEDADVQDGDVEEEYSAGLDNDEVVAGDIPSAEDEPAADGNSDSNDGAGNEPEEENEDEEEEKDNGIDFEEARRHAEAEMTPTSPQFGLGYDAATYRIVMGQPINQPTKILRKVVAVK